MAERDAFEAMRERAVLVELDPVAARIVRGLILHIRDTSHEPGDVRDAEPFAVWFPVAPDDRPFVVVVGHLPVGAGVYEPLSEPMYLVEARPAPAPDQAPDGDESVGDAIHTPQDPGPDAEIGNVLRRRAD